MLVYNQNGFPLKTSSKLVEFLGLSEGEKEFEDMKEQGGQVPKIKWAEPEKPDEVYVIIGNGFDIACGLPTKYSDFLDFLDYLFILRGMKKSFPDKAVEVCVDSKIYNNKQIKSKLHEYYEGDTGYLDKWKSVLESFWYTHFSGVRRKNLKKLGLGWVDFENEISRVIRIIERTMEEYRYQVATLDDSIVCSKDSDLYKVIHSILENAGIEDGLDTNGERTVEYKICYRQLRNKLCEDLEIFITGFETYLREYVEKIDIIPTRSIQNLLEKVVSSNVRRIISFNYTTTFERLLQQYPGSERISEEVCYIHGRITDGTGSNHMVLGMDEYIRDEKIKYMIGFLPFRKYHQRIFKHTDSKYMDWLVNCEETNSENRMLYIMGHSLGITDKDIIGSFIKANSMRSVLFYHSLDALSDQISNLTAIIGRREMISRTGGETHSMEFRKQEQ